MTLTSLRIVPRNFHFEATLSTEFPAADGYSIVNTQNRKRSRVWRSDGSTGADADDNQYVAGTFDDGLDRDIDFFGMFNHRCQGGKVRLQLFSDAAYSVQVYDSTALDVIQAIGTDGADSGIDPYGIGRFDPHITESPYGIFFSPTTCLSYKITFSDHDPSFGVDYWQVGIFALGRSFQPERQPGFGAELGFIDLTEADRSRGGSLYTNVGAQARTMRLALGAVNEDERAAWLDIARRCGLGRDLVLSLFAEEGTRLERDHLMYGTFSALNALGRQVNYLTHTLQFQEA